MTVHYLQDVDGKMNLVQNIEEKTIGAYLDADNKGLPAYKSKKSEFSAFFG